MIYYINSIVLLSISSRYLSIIHIEQPLLTGLTNRQTKKRLSPHTYRFYKRKKNPQFILRHTINRKETSVHILILMAYCSKSAVSEHFVYFENTNISMK